MKLKFTFIFFCLILSVISLNLKKKNENKKSFLQNKLTQINDCLDASHRKKPGERCGSDEVCISFYCLDGICRDYRILKQLGECCACDYHCQSNHCSFNWKNYWLLACPHTCTKD